MKNEIKYTRITNIILWITVGGYWSHLFLIH